MEGQFPLPHSHFVNCFWDLQIWHFLSVFEHVSLMTISELYLSPEPFL